MSAPSSNDLGRRPGGSTTGPARTLVPRHGLPGSRAVVGGLLVALAVVATWWTAAGGDRRPSTRYVVAARRVGPGQELERADLAVVAVELPGAVRSGAFTDPELLVGSVALGPIEPGELVQAGGVGEGAGAGGGRELSFVVDGAWAVDGTLRAGDRIDVWVTYGDGLDATTDQVLDRAVVRRVSAPEDDGLGASHQQTITVALPRLDDVRAATNAARAGTVTVTRSNAVRATGQADEADGAAGGDDPDPRSTTTTTPRTTTTRLRSGG